MTPPENDDFRFNLSASVPGKSYARSVGAGVAALSIVFIILTMTTDLASHILPMKDDYLQVMIPPAPDGAEPLSLRILEHEIVDKTITVRGSVMNLTDYTISGLRAVVEALDTTGRFGQTLELPLDPAALPAHGAANFQTTVTLQEKPVGYNLKFRFVDGPFVPHKDERSQFPSFIGN